MRIKVVKDGITETALVANDTTVGEVLSDYLGISSSDVAVYVNGERVNTDTELLEGDELTIEKIKMKSGQQ